jgi:hypothetical protein
MDYIHVGRTDAPVSLKFHVPETYFVSVGIEPMETQQVSKSPVPIPTLPQLLTCKNFRALVIHVPISA